MNNSFEPNWLGPVSRKLRWLRIPNLAMVFIFFQVVGFFLIMADPVWMERLALFPEAVRMGQVWRLLTFLSLPLSEGIFGLIFGLMFAFYILTSLETEWGEAITTLYVVMGVVLTAIFSLVFDYPVHAVTGFVTTWFLAAATLNPEQTIQIYFLFPVKLKYLGWLAAAVACLEFLRGGWIDRLYLLTLYANYILFFGPTLRYRYQQWQRRRNFKNNFRH